MKVNTTISSKNQTTNFLGNIINNSFDFSNNIIIFNEDTNTKSELLLCIEALNIINSIESWNMLFTYLSEKDSRFIDNEIGLIIIEKANLIFSDAISDENFFYLILYCLLEAISSINQPFLIISQINILSLIKEKLLNFFSTRNLIYIFNIIKELIKDINSNKYDKELILQIINLYPSFLHLVLSEKIENENILTSLYNICFLLLKLPHNLFDLELDFFQFLLTKIDSNVPLLDKVIEIIYYLSKNYLDYLNSNELLLKFLFYLNSESVIVIKYSSLILSLLYNNNNLIISYLIENDLFKCLNDAIIHGCSFTIPYILEFIFNICDNNINILQIFLENGIFNFENLININFKSNQILLHLIYLSLKNNIFPINNYSFNLIESVLLKNVEDENISMVIKSLQCLNYLSSLGVKISIEEDILDDLRFNENINFSIEVNNLIKEFIENSEM